MKKEVKITVNGLQVGMYISRLDRPWIDTPFPLEGLKVNSSDDIERIKKYSSHVFVDMEQGISPAAKYWVLSEKPSNNPFTKPRDIEYEANVDKERAEFAALRKTTYIDKTSFRDEVKQAETISGQLSEDYKKLIRELERGRNIDVSTVKAGITDMVESIVRNPSAMMWVIHLQKLDDYTYSRALGTSVWCATFGRQLGVDKVSIQTLATGGLLLDLGKSSLPSELLVKQGALTDEERDRIQSHVDLGVKLLAKSNSGSEPVTTDVMRMVASHHERANGTGYPQGLKNQQIPLFGRIAGIVDSYDAMTSIRPYLAERPKSPHEAVHELYGLRGTLFQPELVEQFIQTVGLYPTGSLVELNTGEVGAVIAVNGLRRLRPTVMLLLDENKEPNKLFKHLNLSTAGDDIQIVKSLPPGAYGINMSELFL